MASLRVPWVLPIMSGPDVFPQVGRVPAVIRVTLGLKPDLPREMLAFFIEAGQQILDRRRGDLLGYYTQASNAFHAGIVPVMSRHWQFDEGMAIYKMSNGLETLDVVIYPDLAFDPAKKKLDTLPWDYLEFRFEWSIDDGGTDEGTGLPLLNSRRGLYTRAKIRRPKPDKLAKEKPLYVYARLVGGDGEQLYFPWKSNSFSEYFIDGDLDTDAFYHQTWVGAEQVYALGKNPDFDGKKWEQTQYTQYGDRWDGGLYLTYGGYFTGETIGKKHYGSYVLDLRLFPQGEPIDIELRSFWGDSFYLDPADGSPFPDVKLTYRLWSGGTVHWPKYEEEVVLPAGPPVELEDRKNPTFTDIVGGVTYGPYTYQKLRGASTVGLGGAGGTGDGVTFDESEHRDDPGLSLPPAAQVNTPGIYRNFGADGAYSPSGTWTPTPGMYYWYCPRGWTSGAVTEITTTGGVIKFKRDDGTNVQWFTFPQDFELAIWGPQFSGGAFTGMGWNSGGTILPQEEVKWAKANDYFTHSGGSEKTGVLHTGKQVEFYELPANGDQHNEPYYTPGVYFGNITYDHTTSNVTFSDAKGPDPDLRGGPGPDYSEFYATGTP